MADVVSISVDLEQLQDYEFKARFNWGDVPDLLMDEPRPLGGRRGPNASRLLAAALGNCLSASLMYCVARDEVPPGSFRATATCHIVRNDRGRLRVGGIDVRITVDERIERSPRLRRCIALFEDFCPLSTSLREGIPIEVSIVNRAGRLLGAD